jgi:hypothetical protein
VGARPAPLFKEDERSKIVAFWNVPGRYEHGTPVDPASPWQVRLTPDGSAWFLAYQKALNGAGKTPPTQDAAATSTNADWEDWVKAKLVHDRWVASQTADAANAARENRSGSAAQYPPAAPGPMPLGLVVAAGNAPVFSEPCSPLKYKVVFADDETFEYKDHVTFRERFAYYRFPQGTVAYGSALSDMTDAELTPLFSTGMTPSESRIARAVSKLEGGFETVNTYDTGYVSIGFIQFITASDGKGSLAQVLAYEKKYFIVDFLIEFHRFGIDVNDDGEIVVLDPSTGGEISGATAVMKIIEDKRLTAVFQRNGRHSRAFRSSQIAIAKRIYWPADLPVTVTVNGAEITGVVSDVVKSEAGMATLFDRKVNRGNILPFPDVVAQVMTKHKLKTLAAAALYERDIIAQMKYRTDFLQDPTLSQPAPPPE